MVKLLQDFWILSEAGIVIFHRYFDKTLDEQLFGGLLTALNTFAEELEKGGMSNFELSNTRFYMKKKNTFLFVTNTKKKLKPKKVIQELDIIIESFFEFYPLEILKNWNGDISIFMNFENKIEDSLENTVDKFEKAFW